MEVCPQLEFRESKPPPPCSLGGVYGIKTWTESRVRANDWKFSLVKLKLLPKKFTVTILGNLRSLVAQPKRRYENSYGL